MPLHDPICVDFESGRLQFPDEPQLPLAGFIVWNIHGPGPIRWNINIAFD